jgi:hypothetical protein
MNFDKARTTRIALDKQQIGVSAQVSKEVLESLSGLHRDNVVRFATFESRPDWLGDRLLLELHSYLLKSQHTEKTSVGVQIPATWWDHLKQDLCNSRRLWVQRIGFLFTPPTYRTEFKSVDTTIRVCPHNDSYLSKDPVVHFEFLSWED